MTGIDPIACQFAIDAANDIKGTLAGLKTEYGNIEALTEASSSAGPTTTMGELDGKLGTLASLLTEVRKTVMSYDSQDSAIRNYQELQRLDREVKSWPDTSPATVPRQSPRAVDGPDTSSREPTTPETAPETPVGVPGGIPGDGGSSKGGSSPSTGGSSPSKVGSSPSTGGSPPKKGGSPPSKGGSPAPPPAPTPTPNPNPTPPNPTPPNPTPPTPSPTDPLVEAARKAAEAARVAAAAAQQAAAKAEYLLDQAKYADQQADRSEAAAERAAEYAAKRLEAYEAAKKAAEEPDAGKYAQNWVAAMRELYDIAKSDADDSARTAKSDREAAKKAAEESDKASEKASDLADASVEAAEKAQDALDDLAASQNGGGVLRGEVSSKIYKKGESPFVLDDQIQTEHPWGIPLSQPDVITEVGGGEMGEIKLRGGKLTSSGPYLDQSLRPQR